MRGSRGEGGLRGEIAQICVWGLAGRSGQFGLRGRGDRQRAGAGVLVLGAAEELVPFGVTLVTIFSMCTPSYTLATPCAKQVFRRARVIYGQRILLF